MGTTLRDIDEAIGVAFEAAFPADANPWRHLGSLAFLFFVACVASGVYLYAVFDTSVAGAYRSGRALTDDPRLVGRLARGVHRYAADAFALTTALHLAREAARGHFRAWRAWSWLSGLGLVPLAWIVGVTGFWLAWDERALYSMVATAEWLAAAPWRLEAFARNFTTGEAMSDRFFSLAVFVHIGVPLAALALTWAHFLRLSHVRAWPPAPLAAGSLATLASLALAWPAASLGPADAASVPSSLGLDWFFLFPHALGALATPAGLWLGTALVIAALAALPWTRARAVAPAVVALAQCNGCARCAADCPFGAVVMVPRSDGRPHAREARVLDALCAGCGICAGACPSSTPFRRAEPLASGIELPGRSMDALRHTLDAALEEGAHPVIVFACPGAGDPGPPPGVRSTRIGVECAAMVPPAFIDYAVRAGAAGVVIAGCREGDCEYRLGDAWTRARVAARRAPALRAGHARGRVRLVWSGRDPTAVRRAIDELAAMPQPAAASAPPRRASFHEVPDA